MPKSIENLRKTSGERLTVEDRVGELCQNFDSYLVEFDKANPFTGPSVYFHFKTLERLKKIGISRALEDTSFFQYLYATLTSWGMHRMGPKGAKLVEFDEFKTSLQSQKNKILNLRESNLVCLSEQELEETTNRLCNIISNLRVSSTDTQLITGTKALHHLLPNLVPPIDGEYTLRFIYGYKPTYKSDEKKFKKTFPILAKIGNKEKTNILKWVGKRFHTSETKVIDNAIVGYVKKNMKKGERNASF